MNPKYAPHIALIACNFIWALDFPLYKLVLPHYVSPIAMTSSALIIAALLSLITLFFSKREKVSRADMAKFILAGLFMGIGRKIFLMEGMARTSPIDGSIIGTITPLIVLVVSVAAHIDRFTPKKILGLILGMGGAIAVIATGATSSHQVSTLVGNLLILLCVASTAFYMTWFKALIAKYSAATILRWLYCSAAIAILPFGIKPIIETDYSALHGSTMWAYLFILLLPTLGPNFLLIFSLKRLSPTVTSIYAYIQPVVATGVAIAMHMDKLNIETALSAAAIFCGVYFVISSYRTTARAPISHIG